MFLGLGAELREMKAFLLVRRADRNDRTVGLVLRGLENDGSSAGLDITEGLTITPQLTIRFFRTRLDATLANNGACPLRMSAHQTAWAVSCAAWSGGYPLMSENLAELWSRKVMTCRAVVPSSFGYHKRVELSRHLATEETHSSSVPVALRKPVLASPFEQKSPLF